MLTIIYQIILSYLIADFIMGGFHWAKDTYCSPFTPIIGRKFIWDSRLHHIKPRYVLEFSNSQLFFNSAKWTLPWIVPLAFFIPYPVFMFSLFIFISLNEVIHKYAHMMDHERPLFASILQKLYITQSYDDHHIHHISPHEMNYCPMTSVLNPILEKIHFWRYIEEFIEKWFGIKPRTSEDKYVEDEGKSYPAGIKFIR